MKKPPIPFFSPAEAYYNEEERDLAKLEPAWAKAALYFRTGEHCGHPPTSRRTQSMIRIHDQLEVYRKRFEAGDTMALLQAVGNCAEENLPLPTWLALAYGKALKSFLSVGGPPSLDEVFKSPILPTDTPKKAAAARQDWQLGCTLWGDVWKLVHKDRTLLSLDAAFTALLASKDYGVKKTKAKELALMVEKSQLQFLGKTETLSRFLDIRRKAFQVK